MDFSTILSIEEQSALAKLKTIDKYFNQHPFDSSIITPNSSEYNELRKYMD